jgi:sigma-B regulation protein RsbU (phosphoserine phosphatase)
MTPATLVDLSPLPSSVSKVLESYRDVHPEAELRLWAHRDDAWVCLYPIDLGSRLPGDNRHEIRMTEGPALAIEVQSANGGAQEGQFLAQVLSQVIHHEMEARSAARELSERYEEINLLYFISEILGSVLSLPDAATRILYEVADVLGARRASLWVHDAADDQLHLAAAVGEEGLTGPISPQHPDSATALVFRERQAINLERGVVLPNVPRMEPSPRQFEAFLSVPINYTPPEGTTRTVGVITLVGRRNNVRFSAGDARLLSAIASQVGAALETQRLVAESLKQERVVRELELAHDLQLKLLPDLTAFEGPPDVAGRCAPAQSVGGDFYHLIRLSSDRVGIMIGDVSSHGFPAALIMTLTMSAVAIYSQDAGPPAEVLRRVHRAVIKELESTEMYLTLFYGVVDRSQRQIVYANAGHPHAFRISGDGVPTRLGATDLPLGMMALDEYGEGTATWAEDDVLFLFTDGLSDAYPQAGAMKGEEALVADVANARTRPLADIVSHIFATAERSDANVPPDDRTALLVRG